LRQFDKRMGISVNLKRERVRFYLCVIFIMGSSSYFLLYQSINGLFSRCLATSLILLMAINFQYVRLSRRMSDLWAEGNELAQVATFAPFSGAHLVPFTIGIILCTWELRWNDAEAQLVLVGITGCLLLLMSGLFERLLLRLRSLLPRDESGISAVSDYQQALEAMSRYKQEPLGKRVAATLGLISVSAISSDIIVFLIVVLWIGYFVYLMFRG